MKTEGSIGQLIDRHDVCFSSQWQSSSGSGSAGERGGGDWAGHRTTLPTGKTFLHLQTCLFSTQDQYVDQI